MGNFSRNTFEPQKNYVGVRLQQGVPLVDADWNELNDVVRQELYEGLDLTFATGVIPGTDQLAAAPVSPPAPNDLLLLDGRGLVGGKPVRVRTPLRYSTQPWTQQVPAAQAGVQVIPPLTTPTTDRIDIAYLDVWEREVRSAEDTTLINPIIGIETCVRLRREAALRIEEGTTLLPPATEGHAFMPLALLRRRGGQAVIDANQLQDLRPSLYGKLGIATGLVVFESALTTQDTISGPINPGLGPGPIGVLLGLDNNQIFVQPFGLAQTPGLPQASVGAIVDPNTGQFRLGVRPQGTATTTIRVRWWAFRPSQDLGTLVVPQGISVTLDPQTITLRQGEQRRFTAAVTGTPNQTVTWSVQEGATGGVIDASGNYIAPARPGVFHVVASSQVDATKTAVATVTVLAVAVAISPNSTPVLVGGQQQFTATVTGAVNTAVTWRVQETGGGSVTTTGLYTAPGAAGTFHVIATSQTDTTKNATATVTVTKPKDAKDTKDGKDSKDDKDDKEGEKLVRAEKLAPKETDHPPVADEPPQPAAPRRRRRGGQQPAGRAFIAQGERPEVGRDILRDES
jgi:hypothetical protein